MAVIKLICCCLLALPLRHLSLSSPFGYRIHPITGKYAFHAGIDLRARSDTVFAVMDGRVAAVGYDTYLGLFIRLNSGDFQITYGHLSQVFAFSGDTVKACYSLGVSGMTGRVTGEHLHFAVRYRHAYVDPLKFLMYIANNFNQINKETNK